MPHFWVKAELSTLTGVPFSILGYSKGKISNDYIKGKEEPER